MKTPCGASSAKIAKDSDLACMRNVVESEDGEHKIEGSESKLAQLVFRSQAIIASGIELMRDPQHVLGNINSGHIEPKLSEKSRRSPGTAAEIKRPHRWDLFREVFRYDCRQIAIRQEIGVREFERGVCSRPAHIIIAIAEAHSVHQLLSSRLITSFRFALSARISARKTRALKKSPGIHPAFWNLSPAQAPFRVA
jgi:hypothetical protein